MIIKHRARVITWLLVLAMTVSLLTVCAFAEQPKESAAAKPAASETVKATDAEQKVTETKPAETKPAETKPAESKHAEASAPTETIRPVETEPPVPETEPVEPSPATEIPLESDVAESEATEPEKETKSMFRFSPDGQLTLVDDFEYTGMDADGNVISKQFITVQSRDGSYFYIIIDRVGETENVHFLNQVDLSDLKAAASNAQQSIGEDVCTCTSTCKAGHINMDCPVCAVNMTKCAAIDSPEQEDEPKDDPDNDVSTEKEKGEKETSSNGEPTSQQAKNPYVTLVLLLMAIVGIVVFLVKGNVFGGKGQPAQPREYDDDDDDDWNEEESNEDVEDSEDDDADPAPEHDVDYVIVDDEEGTEDYADDMELS